MTLDSPIDPHVLVFSAVLLAVAAGLAFTARFEHLASRVALPALIVQLIVTLPLTHNHFFLELYAVMLLAFAGPDGRDDDLVLQSLRWLTAIVLFHTGWQKISYGHYWRGDFLAFMVGRGDRFADLFQWMLPAADVTRLQGYDPFRHGSGPYRVESLLFVLAANSVWLAEVALPAALLARRTRTVAFVVALVFFASIQLGARELGFGLLFVNLLLLFAPYAVARPAGLAALVVVACVPIAAFSGTAGASIVRSWHLW